MWFFSPPGSRFHDRYGATIINCINREYCKKIIIMLPGQENPAHSHLKKEETFQVLHGVLTINIAGEEKVEIDEAARQPRQ